MKRLAFLLGLLLATPAQAQQIFTGSAGLSVASGAFTCTSAGVCTLNPVSSVATSFAIGGCTIGANAVCVTGLVDFEGATGTNSALLVNSASGFTGKLIDLKVNGTRRFDIDVAATKITGTGYYYDSTVGFFITDGANGNFTSVGLRSISTGGYAWSPGANANIGADTAISRSAAGLIQIGTALGNALGSWLATNGTLSGTLTFSAAASGPILKQGANGRVGTFVLNGSTPVTVSNTSVAVTDAIIISLNTVGGVVGVPPSVATITAATGFTVAGTAADTSTYNYAIIKNAP